MMSGLANPKNMRKHTNKHANQKGQCAKIHAHTEHWPNAASVCLECEPTENEANAWAWPWQVL